jgi:hypothetical protein
VVTLSYHPTARCRAAHFWDIRKELDPDPTDRIVALAWQSMSWPIEEPRIAGSFVRSLLDAAEKFGGDATVAKVRGILRARKIPLPH